MHYIPPVFGHPKIVLTVWRLFVCTCLHMLKQHVCSSQYSTTKYCIYLHARGNTINISLRLCNVFVIIPRMFGQFWSSVLCIMFMADNKHLREHSFKLIKKYFNDDNDDQSKLELHELPKSKLVLIIIIYYSLSSAEIAAGNTQSMWIAMSGFDICWYLLPICLIQLLNDNVQYNY